MNFCVVQQVQEKSVIVNGCQLWIAKQNPHLVWLPLSVQGIQMLCGYEDCTAWSMDRARAEQLQLPLLSPTAFRYCWTVKGDVHNLHQDPHKSRSKLPMPGPILTIAELLDFCSTSSMPLIRRLGCVVSFFFFAACKAAQLIVLEN